MAPSTIVRALVPAFLSAMACSPVYAPLVRGTHYGAPARLEAQQVEVGGTAGGVSYPSVGGPHLAVGIEDWLSIEAGANLAFVDATWTMGWLGVRMTRAPEADLDWVGDIELGAGAGVGGSSCPDDTSCAPWTSLTAGGGYAGLGLGIREEIVAAYVRSRVEVSAARGIEPTVWPTAMVGIDFTIDRAVVLGAGGGYIGLYNAHHQLDGWFYQLQMSIVVDLPSAFASEN